MRLDRLLSSVVPPPVRRAVALRSRLRTLPWRTRRQLHHLVNDPTLGEADCTLLRAVNTAISNRDNLYSGDGRHYYLAGLSAVRCIEVAVGPARLNSIQSVLDMACGFGRVMRFLRARFPEATLTACESEVAGADYCRQQFGAIPAYSRADFDQLALGTRFDLIWCGSLATHLDAAATLALFRFFHRHLTTGGVAVVTLHGRKPLEALRGGRQSLNLSPEGVAAVLAGYDRDGYGYADYPATHGYGISVTSPEWVRTHAPEAGTWGEVYHADHAWDNNQDVYGLIRVG